MLSPALISGFLKSKTHDLFNVYAGSEIDVAVISR